MINGKEKLLWILYGIVLITLFLLSSTDLIIKEKKAEIYPVSVIIEDTTDDYYVNFRKGMERAAVELNADVSFITLYEQGNRKQQMDFAMREQEDGSRALIVAAVDEELVYELQNVKRMTTPLVLLNADPESVKGDTAEGITFDYYRMGCQLGERLIKEQTAECPIYLFSCNGHELVNRRIAEGLFDVLKPAGFTWKEYCLEQSSDFKTTLEGLFCADGEEAVIAALDPESLTAAAQLLSEDTEHVFSVRALYGRGNTVPILNYLDKGVIQGLCIEDDFSAGYVSVRTAVELMNGRFRREQEDLKELCIGREELRTGGYEKMLCPIE